MPQTDRSLVEHLAKVMGWKTYGPASRTLGGQLWVDERGNLHDNLDPDSWADAGALWEKAQQSAESVKHLYWDLHAASVQAGMTWQALFWFLQHATPRLICLAVARATGYVEEEKDG